MAKRKYSPEQIIDKLRAIELTIAQGDTVEESCRKAQVNPRPTTAGAIATGA